MANELYIFSTPKEAQVKLRLDSGQEIIGQPVEYDNREDAHLLQLPDGTTAQGSELFVTLEGYERAPSDRGITVPTTTCPHCGQLVSDKPHFELDDIRLQKKPAPAPPTPGPPVGDDPLSIINAVYATGAFNLKTKEGCGQFTEECCRQLAAALGKRWGHVFKTPGQNQYQKHAVDALMCLPGEYDGIWDIIYSSASSSAKPVFNRAGDVKPELWRPPQPLPCQDRP